MDAFPPTECTTLRRHPERGRFDRETIYAILDEAPICHVGFVGDGRPVVIPTIHARDGDSIVLHGSPVSRMLRTLRNGGDVCITATLIDGLVLARSAFHHSMNYRSAVVFGTATEITDPDEKQASFRAVVEHVLRGRWDETRAPSRKETAGTMMLRVTIDDASAKVRSGPPIDDPEDLALAVWAGVVPLRVRADDPVIATPDQPLPASVRALLDL